MGKNIALIGFMGSGKTTIGRLLAEKVGWRHVDMDDIIEAQTGKHIPEIFEEQGETAFRDYETEALKSLINQENLVVACGGGIILREDNVKRLRRYFHVIYLDVSLEELKKRLRRSRGRPLIEVEDPERKIEELYQFRQILYHNTAHNVLPVNGNMSAWQNTERLLGSLASGNFNFNPRRLKVNLGSRSYQILIGSDLLPRAGKLIQEAKLTGKAVIISDENVGPLYKGILGQSLSETGFKVEYLEIKGGEKQKSLKEAEKLYNQLLALRLDRQASLIALGGGVIGDLVGFVASTFMRGLPLIQVPTTLLSQVDSSIGGKTAVNLTRAKNIVGTFYQPKLVLIDILCLQSLPKRELRAGLAEVIKYGFLVGSELLNLIEEQLPLIQAGHLEGLNEIVYHCCAYKAAVVEEDELDKGRRAVLNYGHTIGHALEAASAYRKFVHGEAISVGMYGAALMARRLGFIDDNLVKLHYKLLGQAGLPLSYSGLDPEKIYSHLELDKKRLSANHRLVLLRGAGNPVITAVASELIHEVLIELGRDG